MSNRSNKSNQRPNSSSSPEKFDLAQTTREESSGPEESPGATIESAPRSVSTTAVLTAQRGRDDSEKLEAEDAKSAESIARDERPSSFEEDLAVIEEALSGYDPGLSYRILGQLRAIGSKEDPSGARVLFWRSILKTVTSGKPIEIMLVTQMIVLHETYMALAQPLWKSAGLDEIERWGNILNKFARTFTTQTDTLQRLRSGPEPKFHVSVNDNAQAIVGSVTQNNTVGTPPGAATAPLVSDQSGAPMPMVEFGRPTACKHAAC